MQLFEIFNHLFHCIYLPWYQQAMQHMQSSLKCFALYLACCV